MFEMVSGNMASPASVVQIVGPVAQSHRRRTLFSSEVRFGQKRSFEPLAGNGRKVPM